ncbi:MAG TPA: GNAT family N-acyltransferase [Terriglobales bacterium]|nr:GNAT family N-acyltransferase [Terriglobales bacterium]
MPITSLTEASQELASPPPKTPQLFRRLSAIERVRELYQRAQQPVNRSILENVLTGMRVQYQVTESDWARVPTKGAAIVTANHPFGLLDGAILGALLTRVRTDVKILTNFMLAGIPELREHCIFVDPFGGSDSVARNWAGVRKAMDWLAVGGMLVVFPAGEVSHLRLQDFGIADPPWNSMVARLASKTSAVVVPVFIAGHNSATFLALGLMHPRLRTAWLLNEFLQQTGKTVEVRVGHRISPEILGSLGSDREAATYLRWRTYVLAQRGRTPGSRIPSALLSRKTLPLAAAIPTGSLVRDLQKLGPDRCLWEDGEFAFYIGKAREFPAVMLEIGRLRELTFRQAGEGTGGGSDLDQFDYYYTHFVLWNKTKREIVGAYRVGLTTQILPQLGVPGLYTSTLFRYDPRFFPSIGPAMELGRSFVHPEYQKQYAPLLNLWKGIGRYVGRHPRFAVLFGAVSISQRYNRLSRELIFRFFQNQGKNDGLARLVAPRSPFHPRPVLPAIGDGFCRSIRHLDHLADPIADIENDGKGIPILVKHYTKLGGRMLSFNLDRNFSNVLDGLVLVDLRRSDPALLARYMGKADLTAFIRHHGLHGAAEVS